MNMSDIHGQNGEKGRMSGDSSLSYRFKNYNFRVRINRLIR